MSELTAACRQWPRSEPTLLRVTGGLAGSYARVVAVPHSLLGHPGSHCAASCEPHQRCIRPVSSVRLLPCSQQPAIAGSCRTATRRSRTGTLASRRSSTNRTPCWSPSTATSLTAASMTRSPGYASVPPFHHNFARAQASATSFAASMWTVEPAGFAPSGSPAAAQPSL